MSGTNIFVGDDMDNLLVNLEASEEVVKQIWSTLVSTYNSGGDISKMIADYSREVQKKESYINAIVKVYQDIIARISPEEKKDCLTLHQQMAIKDEMKLFEKVCEKDIRTGSSLQSFENIHPALFKDILAEVGANCPLIHEILETLVVTNPRSRNILKTNNHKMMCALQLLGFMSNIRNSNARVCFPLMFGILCISYGAGKRFIDMLQSMGLSLHWNTMYVKQQSDYKIICILRF